MESSRVSMTSPYRRASLGTFEGFKSGRDSKREQPYSPTLYCIRSKVRSDSYMMLSKPMCPAPSSPFQQVRSSCTVSRITPRTPRTTRSRCATIPVPRYSTVYSTLLYPHYISLLINWPPRATYVKWQKHRFWVTYLSMSP